VIYGDQAIQFEFLSMVESTTSFLLLHLIPVALDVSGGIPSTPTTFNGSPETLRLLGRFWRMG
jgi:hypothetical protein